MPTGDIATGVIGMLAQGYNNQTAEKGAELGLRNQRTLYADQQRAQLDMWKRTGPVGMMEQYKKAGLNPGLVYGMGGGAAGTTGGGTPSSSNVPVTPINIAELSLLKAQRENIEADTANKKASAGYTAGAQTTKTEADTVKTQAETSGQYSTNRIESIRAQIAEETVEEVIKTIGYNMDKELYQTEQAEDQKKITRATRETQIDQIRLNYAIAGLQAAYLKAQTGNVQQDTKLKGAQTKAIPETISQGWREIEAKIAQGWNDLQIRSANMTTQERQQAQDAWVNDIQNSTRLPIDVIKGIMGATILKGITNETIRTPIGFKR